MDVTCDDMRLTGRLGVAFLAHCPVELQKNLPQKEIKAALNMPSEKKKIFILS
jgi:hypothetical protein